MDAQRIREYKLYLDDVDRETKRRPDLWRKCYPRIYREPGNFHSAKLVALRLFEVATKIEAGLCGQVELYELQIAAHLVKYRVPIFFIAPGMMQAMANTATPSDIPWLTMKMPFEAGVFMPPKGTLFHPEEGEIAFVGYTRFAEGVVLDNPLTRGTYGVVNGGMLLFALTEEGLFHHWNMPADQLGERLSLIDIETYQSELSSHDSSTGYGAMQLTEADNALLVPVAHYIFSSLLIMTERPQMLTTGVLEKRVPQRNEAPKEFWSPNIIGAGYAVQQERTTPLGHHSSPRLHFVRGFWRHQVHGQGRSLRRLQWIEPFIRGAEQPNVTQSAPCPK